MFANHLEGSFWEWWSENLPERHVWLRNELDRLYRGGFKSSEMFRELGPFMAKMSQLNATVRFHSGCIDVTFGDTKISLVEKTCYKPD